MKRTVCFIMTAALCISALFQTAYAQTISETFFEQNFDSSPSGITQANFKMIERPADGSDTYADFVSGTTENGALMSDISSADKAEIKFGQSFTGTFSLEADFRLEGRAYTASSGQVKFFDAFSAKNKNIFMITSGTNDNDGYAFRPVYCSADGKLQTGSAGGKLMYKKWYHLKVSVTTDTDEQSGTVAFYIDGEKLCEGYSRAGYAQGNLDSLAKVNFYQAADGAYPFIIDNVKITMEREASSDTSVSSTLFTFTENEAEVFSGATVMDLLSDVSNRNGAAIAVTDKSGSQKTSGALSEGDILKVTAEDGTVKNYAVTFGMEKPFSYRQSFNENADGITLNGFAITDKNGAAYTPDGTKDGMLTSLLGSTNSAKIALDKTCGSESEISFSFCYEGYDGTNISNGNIKLADIKNSRNQTILLVTAGNPVAGGYQFRLGSTAYGKSADLKYGTWYTAKIVMHEKTAKIDAYLDGALVAEGLSAWQNASPVNAASVLTYSSVDTNTKHHYLDNITAVRKYTVSANAGSGGKLLKGTSAFSAEETLKEGTYSFTASADDGYAIDRIAVTQGENTVYPTANAYGSFDVTINADTEIAVTFKAAEAAGISKTELITGTRTVSGKEYKTYAVYASVTAPSEALSYGAVIENSEGKALKLSGEALSAMKNAGKFAILVYGEGLSGQTCTLMPYITTESGTINGAKTQEFTD